MILDFWAVCRRFVVVAIASVVSITTGYGQDTAVDLEAIAKELPGITLFKQNRQPIPLEEAVICLIKKERVDEVATGVKEATGFSLGDVASQLNRRVRNGIYREYNYLDAIRTALGAFGGSEYSTVYSFPVGDVLGMVGSDTALRTIINLGSVRPVAMQDDGQYRLVDPGGADWHRVMTAIGIGKSGTDVEGYELISRDSNLEGIDSTERLISWDVDADVLPEGVFLQTSLLRVLVDATREAEC